MTPDAKLWEEMTDEEKRAYVARLREEAAGLPVPLLSDTEALILAGITVH